MKILLAAVLVAILGGCVVTPYPRTYGPEPVVVYPGFYWEPSISLWFRVGPHGNRVYQPHGFDPRGQDHREWHHERRD
jgi:hypothetical protein